MSLGTRLKQITDNYNKDHKKKEEYEPLNVKLVSNIEEVMNFIETNYYFIECAKRGHYKYKMVCDDDNKEIWSAWKELAKHPLTHKEVTFQYVKKLNSKKKHYLVFSWK
jgi:hypothetical protein